MMDMSVFWRVRSCDSKPRYNMTFVRDDNGGETDSLTQALEKHLWLQFPRTFVCRCGGGLAPESSFHSGCTFGWEGASD